MYRATVSKGIAGRIDKTDNLEWFTSETGQIPRFGFYWWFWLPKFNTNNGSFKRKECVDISINWLCFWVGLIFWP